MDPQVPYMPSVANFHRILDKIQSAGIPETFNLDFLKDLGFTSSNDRAAVKLLKYLGFLDPAGRPQTAYREFMNHTQAKKVLAARLKSAYDDLYLSDREAHNKTAEALKGWFKTKTGESDSVAKKIATTFKSLAQYADFSGQMETPPTPTPASDSATAGNKIKEEEPPIPQKPPRSGNADLSFVYRIEIHLPDTQNIDTFRAIFKALREEIS